MTVALLAALVAVNIAYLILLDRKDARAHRERDAQRAETQVWLQRIQDPSEAVFAHATKDTPVAPQTARLDDDESYWQAETSKDELAEALMRHELQDAARAG